MNPTVAVVKVNGKKLKQYASADTVIAKRDFRLHNAEETFQGPILRETIDQIPAEESKNKSKNKDFNRRGSRSIAISI